MRIVFISYHYSPDIHSPSEWVQRLEYYNGWLECLVREHTIIRVDQINFTGRFIHNGVEYHCIDDGKKKNYFPGKLNRFVKGLDPDVVVVGGLHFPLQVLQLRSCLGGKIKIILQHHAERPFTGFKRYLQRLASRKADAFLFSAYEMGEDWVRKKNLHSLKKVRELVEISSVFHFIQQEKAREKVHINGAPVFLWVGRLNQNKDPITAVKAFLRFALLFPATKLFMIYHTEELASDITALLSENGDDNNPIVLIGKIQHKDLLYWFNSADFFLSASHYESGGTALCEAMSCGCIPIVTNIPPFRKIAGNCGILFERGNENSLYEALIQSMKFDRYEKRNTVLNWFDTELSFEALAIQFKQIIASL